MVGCTQSIVYSKPSRFARLNLTFVTGTLVNCSEVLKLGEQKETELSFVFQVYNEGEKVSQEREKVKANIQKERGKK
jgi:hypothetical protein